MNNCRCALTMDEFKGHPYITDENRKRIARVLNRHGIEPAINTAFELGRANGQNEMTKFLITLKNFFKVDRVVVNGRATIVFWHDGDKTIVKAEPGTKPDLYYGFTAAVTKRVIGTNTQVKRILKEKVEIQKPKEKKKSDSKKPEAPKEVKPEESKAAPVQKKDRLIKEK